MSTNKVSHYAEACLRRKTSMRLVWFVSITVS